ncbi:hypothetical protein PsAD5_00109 [Pseudovibrio sp. Ad5]|nr:hypothetical protein PsAD5_00109 [Pseudovibrio sp. Ad5]
MSMANRCEDCKHCSYEYDSEDHYITAEWFECHARKGIENLRSFPFKNTSCKQFVSKQSI